jgi:tRNA modification GTPase
VNKDTIVALATPPGRGGIGVVRLSGPRAQEIAQSFVERPGAFEPRHATFTRLVLPSRGAIDHVVVISYPGPASYTGEDVVEISAHGSPVLLQQIVGAALERGARLAARGEFTLRAFLNGRLDLVQAEAVADLVAASTPLQARAAFDQLDGTLTARMGDIDAQLLDLAVRFEASLDFPEEGYTFIDEAEGARRIGEIAAQVEALACEGRRGRLLREGITVAIVGRPNVGKSSVFNRLAGAERAIVHAAPGTTRDLISEIVDMNGLAVTLVDTAGVRPAEDAVEAEGVRRANQSIAAADLVLAVFDTSAPLSVEDRSLLKQTESRPRLIVLNKADLPVVWTADMLGSEGEAVTVSARDGKGMDLLRGAIAEAAGVTEHQVPAAVTNMRHVALLERALAALRRAERSASEHAYEELVLADIHEARSSLEEVTGRRTSDDLLNEIFDRFCIGK